MCLNTNIIKLTVTFVNQCICMNPVIKKLGIRSVIVLSSLFVLAVLLAAIFEDEIGKKIISELNKQVKTKLTVQDVSLSLIRHFPKASVTLFNTNVDDTKGKKLLEIGELSLSMGLWSVFSGQPVISAASIRGGFINISIDDKGKTNYDILISDPKNKSKNNNVFTINKASIQDFKINYLNDIKQSNYALTLRECTMKGAFSDNKFNLEINSDAIINALKHEKTLYLENKPFKLAGIFDVDNAKGVYNIKDCKLDLASNMFSMQGSIKNTKAGTDFDLYALGKDINLETVSNLVSAKMNQSNDFESKGMIQINARIDGVLNVNSNPAVLVQYNLKNGSLEGKKIEGSIDQISFSGKFTNGWSHKMSTSSFSLENCSASFNGLPFTLGLNVFNLEQPLIRFNANGKIPLGKIYHLFPEIQGGSGYVNLKQLAIEGELQDMKDVKRAEKVKASGSIQFENAILNYRGEDLKFANGNVAFANAYIQLNKISLIGLDSDIEIEGKISNYLAYIFSNTVDDQLNIDISIKSNSINIEKWMYVLSTDKKVSNNQKDSVATNKPFQSVIGTIKVNLDEAKYKKILAKNFTGELMFEKGDMLVSGDVIAMEGDWNVEGILSFQDRYTIKATLESNKVNIKQFFIQTDNFGQATLTDKNLSGKLNSKILLMANWDKNGNFDSNSLHVYGGISIDNGELMQFPMMENFSSFVKIKDLRDIRFVNLKNLLEIENGVIYLPAMFIQSNAVNLTVSGQHAYSGDIDYNFKINAGQILLNKFNLLNKIGDALPAKKGGFFNLYYNLKGDLTHFNTKSNKALVKSNFTSSEIRKHKILNVLLAEFGSLYEFEEPTEWIDQGEKASIAKPILVSSTTESKNLNTSLKSTFQQARQTLKDPTKTVIKPEKKGFKDEEEENVEYLDFK